MSQTKQTSTITTITIIELKQFQKYSAQRNAMHYIFSSTQKKIGCPAAAEASVARRRVVSRRDEAAYDANARDEPLRHIDAGVPPVLYGIARQTFANVAD